MERLGWGLQPLVIMTHRVSASLPSLYLITDRKLATPNLFGALESALQGGVRLIQLREKDLLQEELRQLAPKVLQLSRFYGARLLINGQPEIAAEIGADGVHLGVQSVSVARARQTLGQGALIGYSAHSASEIEQAAIQGADFATFSPIYHTPSKANYGPPQGLKALQDICRQAPLPVYALGGIGIAQVDEVLQAGASGIAVISAILQTRNPKKSAQDLLHKTSAPVEGLLSID